MLRGLTARRALRSVVAAATLLFGGASLDTASVLENVQDGGAWTLVCLGALQLGNSGLRGFLHHWREVRMRRVLAGELLLMGMAPLGTGVTCLLPRPALGWLGEEVVVFLGMALFYEAQHQRIYELVENKQGLEHCTDFFEKCNLPRLIGIKRSLGQMLRESSQWPQRLAARLLERSDARRLSVARVLVAALVTYCLMVTGITALALGAGLLPSRRPPESRGAGGASAGPGERSRAVSRGSGSAKAAGRNDQSRGGSAVGAGLRSAGSTGGSSPAGGRAPDSQRAGAPESDAGSEAERSWEVVCGPLPSYGAPEWAKAQIDALYLGGMRLHAEPAPGAAGGCTQRAVVPWYAHEGLVYTVGRDRHNEIRSTAVDSRRFGPAIFLAPAAQIVLRLLEEEAGPVGGTPRIFVENGDFLSVETERGTFILVRPEEHMRGRPRWAYPYTELPPAVAKAWTIAMWSWHRWLWPYRHERAGRTTFALALSPITRIAVDSIEYETAGHTATYRGVSYSGTEARFSERELREYAELARWHRP